MSKWESDGIKGQFSLVVSLDWNPNAGEKALLDDSFRIFAKDVWRMTEGKHQLKTLYVYTPDPVSAKALNWDKADIKIKNITDADEADASVNGFKHYGARIMVELDIQDLEKPDYLAEMGHALAHEMGHYAYGLFDEYEGDEKGEKSDPWPGDTPAPTLMADHTEYLRLSIADDYKDATKRATAHYRTYGASAWSVLVRDPKDDPKSVLLQEDYRRIGYSDLIALKKEPVLTQPTDNPALDIIYINGSEVCILIESSSRMAANGKLDRAKAGAKFILDQLSSKDYVSVVEFYDVPKIIGPLAMVSEPIKTNYKTEIDGLDAEGGVILEDGLRKALDILKSSPRKDTFKYIVVLTEGQNPTGTILSDLKKEGFPVYAVGVSSSADMAALSRIASSTAGQAYSSANTAQLITVLSNIFNQNGLLRLNKQYRASLTNNQTTATSQVMISNSAKTAFFQVGFPETDDVEFSLIAPSGDVITPGNLAGFPKVTYVSNKGYAVYRIISPSIGVWRMTSIAKSMAGATSDVIMEAKSDVDFILSLEITPGSYPKPMIVMAVIQRNHNIKGLAAKAYLTDPNGVEKIIDLKDDGISPDEKAGDGKYTGALLDYVNGKYQVRISVDNSGGQGVETSKAFALKHVWKRPIDIPVSETFFLERQSEPVCEGVKPDTEGVSFETAYTLPVDGSLIAGQLGPAGDKDYYVFQAQPGQTYNIFTTELFPANMNTSIKLYDSDRKTLLATGNFNPTADGTAAEISWISMTASGSYYVVVETSFSDKGFYYIGVKSEPSGPSGGGTSSNGGGGCFITSFQ